MNAEGLSLPSDPHPPFKCSRSIPALQRARGAKRLVGPPGAESLPVRVMGIIGLHSVVHFAGVTQWSIPANNRTASGSFKSTRRRRTQQASKMVIRSSSRVHEDRLRAQHSCLRIFAKTPSLCHTFGPTQQMARELGTPVRTGRCSISDRYLDNLTGHQACRIRTAWCSRDDDCVGDSGRVLLGCRLPIIHPVMLRHVRNGGGDRQPRRFQRSCLHS